MVQQAAPVERASHLDIDHLLKGGLKAGASDIHLLEESHPYFRVDGVLLPVKMPAVPGSEMRRFLKDTLPKELLAKLERTRNADFAYQYKDRIRCRFNAFFDRKRLNMIIRLIPLEIPTIEKLQLPPILDTLIDMRRGMILVTGTTGSGKSTTLAAIVDGINSRKRRSIITIENPIEYVYENKKAMISQREVGDDVESFNDGLMQALRQDPDVILVGEIRSLETAATALQAAETGHLVLSTLHTNGAVQTVERLIGLFPEEERAVVIDQLASNLNVVITQELIRRIEGKGRIAALEILMVTAHVRKLIREKRIEDIEGLMTGGENGMQIMDQALALLVREKKVSAEDAQPSARDRETFLRRVKGIASSGDRGAIMG